MTQDPHRHSLRECHLPHEWGSKNCFYRPTCGAGDRTSEASVVVGSFEGRHIGKFINAFN